MKLIASILVATGSLTIGVLSAAVPFDFNTVIARQNDGSAQPEFNDAVIGNLSRLFGWQLAGAFSPFPEETAANCADISNLGRGKWGAMGLNPTDIQEPSCTVVNADTATNPTKAVTNVINYTTQIFITQLLGSFDNDALQYMCNQLEFYLIDYFMLDSTDVVGAICNSVGEPLPPRPFAPATEDPSRDVAAAAVKDSTSSLYALMLAAGATTDTQLSTNCEIAPQYNASLTAELLDGAVYEEVTCAITEPISVDEAVTAIYTWITRSFITTIENISNVAGWQRWLCSHIDKDLMNSMTLDGDAVSTQICADGSTS